MPSIQAILTVPGGTYHILSVIGRNRYLTYNGPGELALKPKVENSKDQRVRVLFTVS